MTYIEVEKKIEEFKASEEFKLLTKPNFLQIAGKSRSETAFTSLFAWVLSNQKFKDLQVSPIVLFLKLLSAKANEQEKKCDVELMDAKIKKAIESNQVEIDVLDYTTEYYVRAKKRKKRKNGKEGRVDLVIICKFRVESKEASIGIIIENKIDHDEENDQCKFYYEYFFKKPEIIINGTPYRTSNDVQDIYVFSSIENKDDKEVSCSQYIFITHQDIYNNILLPIYKSISCHPGLSLEEDYLKEYMSALTSIKTDGKIQIVRDEDMRQVLKHLYIYYQDFIDRVIIEGREDPHLKNVIIKNKKIPYGIMDEGTRDLFKGFYRENQDLMVTLMSEGCEDCKEIVEALHNKRKSSGVRFEIYFEEEYIIETNQRNLLADLVKDYMERFNASREDVKNLFSNKNKIEDIFVDDYNSGYVVVEVCGVTYKISDQRTRNPEYLGKIISTFGEKGYKVIAL